MPGIISRLIVEPAGGKNISGDSVGDNCDQLLKNQLVFQRGASTDDRMQEVIRQIQAQRDNCVSELWNPTVDDSWHGTGAANTDQRGQNPKVGDLTVPTGLFGSTLAASEVRDTSGRDSDNNIIVFWDDDSATRPADGAKCWMFSSRLNTWGENY